MKLILLLAVLPALASSCAFIGGFSTWLDGRCFRQNYQTSVFFDEASHACSEEQGHLPSIFSQVDNDQFYLALSHQFGYTFWLGLSCDGEKFVWADGSKANYTNFAANYNCTKATMDSKYYYGNDKLWYESWNGKDSSVNNVVCEGKARSASPCDSYDEVETEGTVNNCYSLQQATTDWENAEALCSLDGGTLAIIHNQGMNDFIRRTAVSAGLLDGVHIGIQKITLPNGWVDWGWVDGTAMDITSWANFQPGFPSNDKDGCVYMSTKQYPGQWGSIDCERIPLPFICTKHAFYPLYPQPEGCPRMNKFEPNTEMYSPSYPAAPGVGDCEYLLLDEDPNKKVQLEIVFLESNSCCDTLTIYDGQTGSNVLSTLSGYHPDSINIIANSNAVRLHWNATSGANVRGFHARMLDSVSKRG